MLLTVEKGIKDGICHTIHRYTTRNNKYMKSYNKDEESSYLIYWDVNNLYVWWATSQKLPADSFERVKNTSQFDESCMKNMMKIVIKDTDLEKMLDTLTSTVFTTKNEN